MFQVTKLIGLNSQMPPPPPPPPPDTIYSTKQPSIPHNMNRIKVK